MPYLVRDVLIVSPAYDRFNLDEDGRLAERILTEYLEQHLVGPPRIHHVHTAARALELLARDRFELLITMARLPDMPAAELARRAKVTCPGLSVALIAYDAVWAATLDSHTDRESIDRVFVWKGDPNMLLGIVKCIEDMRNVDHDTQVHLVRVIVLVEDSPAHYSAFLAMLYAEVLQQSRALIAAGMNHLDRLYRRRARPKILLATTYEEAIALCKRYEDYILAVITDMNLPRSGVSDPRAGLDLIAWLRSEKPDIPILLQSAEPEDREHAHRRLRVSYAHKDSGELLAAVRGFLRLHCGFGPFVFRDEAGSEVGRADDLWAMRQILRQIPGDVLKYHGGRHHFSNWLFARGEFLLGVELRQKHVRDFEDTSALREYLIGRFTTFLELRHRGQITEFSRSPHHLGRDFVRLAGGSLGGKGRGVAFLYKLLEATPRIRTKYPEVRIIVPRTAVICTDQFDAFVAENDLPSRIRDADDAHIAQAFLQSRISEEIHRDLGSLLEEIRYPLAVRSSSLLEDSEFRPFAGVYNSFMLPNNAPELRIRLKQLRRAIKLVYASTFLSNARAYRHAVAHSAEEEKMAVLIQRLVGTDYGKRFYPTFAGVAQSVDYYPLEGMQPEDGVALVALGLGRTVVEGGRALRVPLSRPNALPDMSTPAAALRATQRDFFAVAMDRPNAIIEPDGEDTLVRSSLDAAEADGTLRHVGATYVAENDRIYDTIHRDGVRLVNFARVLKQRSFPMAAILKDVLALGKAGFGGPVEVEFAANLDVPSGSRPELAVVQIRPIVTTRLGSDTRADGADEDLVVVRSKRAMGDGVMRDIRDIVLVPPERFDRNATTVIADEVGRINAALMASARPYLLIGPGRWGTKDRHLGIPVTWPQVSGARVIVETQGAALRADPSQGTHFFHNITSLRVGYLTVDAARKGEYLDWDWLLGQPVESRHRHALHVHLHAPLEVVLDGRTGCAVILRAG